jgi:peptidoglycan/LPS O-acetylase OafA/YrhL
MKFEAMAIGGLGAYLVYHYGNRLIHHFIFKRLTQFVILSMIVIYLLSHLAINQQVDFEKQFFATSIKSCFFLYLILVVSVLPNKIISLEKRIFTYLGEISYGIYMFHLLVATLVLEYSGKIAVNFPLMNGVVYYSLIFGFTILISALSKRYFEAIFMKKPH